MLEYLIAMTKVDSLKVINAHNIARYARNKADVEAMKFLGILRHFWQDLWMMMNKTNI